MIKQIIERMREGAGQTPGVKSTAMNFGKQHYSKPFKDVPRSYFQWMLANVSDLDRNLRASIELHLRAA